MSENDLDRVIIEENLKADHRDAQGRLGKPKCECWISLDGGVETCRYCVARFKKPKITREEIEKFFTEIDTMIINDESDFSIIKFIIKCLKSKGFDMVGKQ